MGKRIIDFCVILLSIIACFFIGLFVYQTFFDKKFSLAINHIGDQVATDAEIVDGDVDSSDIDRRVLFQVNYYSNKNENGEKLRELVFNYFDDWTLSENVYRSSGIQLINDYYSVTNDFTYDDKINLSSYNVRMSYNYSTPTEMENMMTALNANFGYSDLYYYDWTADVSYQGAGASVATGLQINHPYIIKLDGKPYAISLDKTYTYAVKNFWHTWTPKTNYTWGDVFEGCMAAVEGNSGGYGDFYIKGDFSKYFTIYGFNAETGKFDDDSVTDIIRSYAVVKFHYDENGASSAKDSLFDQMYADANYGVNDVDYSGVKTVYTLTEDDFSLRYSDTCEGNLMTLSAEAKSFIELHPDALFKFDLDISALDNVVGFDYSAFGGVPISKLSLRSDTAKTLIFLNDALSDTGLSTIYRSELLSLSFSDDVSFEEVVL